MNEPFLVLQKRTCFLRLGTDLQLSSEHPVLESASDHLGELVSMTPPSARHSKHRCLGRKEGRLRHDHDDGKVVVEEPSS